MHITSAHLKVKIYKRGVGVTEDQCSQIKMLWMQLSFLSNVWNWYEDLSSLTLKLYFSNTVGFILAHNITEFNFITFLLL